MPLEKRAVSGGRQHLAKSLVGGLPNLTPGERHLLEAAIARGLPATQVDGLLGDYRRARLLDEVRAPKRRGRRSPRAKRPPFSIEALLAPEATPETQARFVEQQLMVRYLTAHLFGEGWVDAVGRGRGRWTASSRGTWERNITRREIEAFVPFDMPRKSRAFSNDTLFLTHCVESFLESHPDSTWKRDGITWQTVAESIHRGTILKKKRFDPQNLAFRFERARESLRARVVTYYEKHRDELPLIARALAGGQRKHWRAKTPTLSVGTDDARGRENERRRFKALVRRRLRAGR